MRCLVVSVGVVLLATASALAAGHSATMSIETAGSAYDPGTGMNEIDCEALPNPFTIEIIINSDDTTGMTAFGVTMTSNCEGIQHAAMETTWIPPYGPLLIENYNGANGWAKANGTNVGAGTLPMAGPPTEEVGTINIGDVTYPVPDYIWGANGMAAWLELTLSGDPCDFICCVIDGMDAYVGDSAFDAMDVTVVPLHIVPEPASAVLLLLGLPFLRRRRR